MADPPIFPASDFIRDAPAQRIYAKSRWENAWQLVDFLWCDWATIAAAPQVSAAQLSWRYGYGMQPGSPAFGAYSKKSLLNQYVKIEIDGVPTTAVPEPDPIRWYGIVMQDADAPDGSLSIGTTIVPTGRQVFQCMGLEVLLDRKVLDKSIVESLAQGDPITVARAITFNGLDNSDDGGNRSTKKGSTGSYVFAAEAKTAELWSTADIVRYLLDWHSPTDRFGNKKLPFQLDSQGGSIITDAEHPRVPQESRSLKQVLDSLLDRRRLISYVIEVDGNEDGTDEPIIIRPFRFNDQDIEVDDSTTLPANTSVRTLDVSSRADVDGISLRVDDAQNVDEVVVVGSRIMACFTVSAQDGTLVKHWDAPLEADYATGAGNEADYPAATELDERKRRDKDFRAADRLRRVYSYFGLSSSWDGMVKDGENGGSSNPYLPSEAKATDPEPFYYPELRFLPTLPLKSDHDYRDAYIAADAVIDNTPDGAQWEYLRPLVLLKLDDPADTGPTDRYAHVEQLAANADTPGTGDGSGRKWSCHFRMQDGAPGIVLRVSGAPQWAIATTDFTPKTSDDDQVGTIDWNDNLVATVAMKADRRVEKRYPPNPPSTDTVRQLVIDLGDAAQLHYVAPYTVVAIEDGELIRSASGGYVRDDRPRLERLARIAYEWYSGGRQAFTVEIRQLLTDITIGELITTVQQAPLLEPVNTPVTEIRWEMPQSRGSQSSEFQTTISTGFAQLDVSRL